MVKGGLTVWTGNERVHDATHLVIELDLCHVLCHVLFEGAHRILLPLLTRAMSVPAWAGKPSTPESCGITFWPTQVLPAWTTIASSGCFAAHFSSIGLVAHMYYCRTSVFDV